MNSKVVFGQYFNSDSWMHRLDPRTKIVVIFLFIAGLFLLQQLWSLLIAFSITVILVISSKIPLSKFLNSLKMVTMLLFVTVIFQVLLSKAGNSIPFSLQLNVLNLVIILVAFTLYFLSKRIIRKGRFLLFIVLFLGAFALQYYVKQGPNIIDYQLIIYEQGLLSSGLIITRIVSLIFISSLLTLTTKPTDLNNGLESLAKPLRLLKINVSIMTMMISISLRFIPTLLNEAEKILKAQASRGVDFKESKFKDKITQIVSLLVPMFVISYKRAGDLADAMEARGYIPEAPRTNINLLQYKTADIITLLIVCMIIAGLITIKVTNWYAI
ncbi:MAG: energy-coupling factor transporter transmembrane protein EcfT [Bacilli bacterium]